MNTGVWLLRPSARVHADLIAYTTGRPVRGFKGSMQYPCGKGFQLAAKHFFASYFGTPRWFARLPERFNCCDKSILPCLRPCPIVRNRSVCPSALEKPQDTPRVHVLHWPGGLKPDHPSVWDAEAGRPKDPIHWNDDPPSKYMFHGPMHPTHNRALRQWHHNYKHALKMLELPTVSQRKEKAGTVGVATLAHGGGLRARLFSFLG